jgi:hypothetical protein
VEDKDATTDRLKGIKWRLWHGDAAKALTRAELVWCSDAVVARANVVGQDARPS